jgi:hypothetical protein
LTPVGFFLFDLDVLADDLLPLTETIEQGISIRGIYLLMDERLDLICGPGALERIDKPEVTQCITKFAEAHGWLVTRYQAGFVFVVDKVIIQPISN